MEKREARRAASSSSSSEYGDPIGLARSAARLACVCVCAGGVTVDPTHVYEFVAADDFPSIGS